MYLLKLIFQSYKMPLAILLKRKKKFNSYFATLTVFKELKSTVIIIRNLLITGHVTNEMPSVPPVARDGVTPKVGAWVGEW